MSTILDALAKARQEKERRGIVHPRVIIKSSPPRRKGRGLRALLLTAVVVLTGTLLMISLRPPWVETVLVAVGFGKKQPADSSAVSKPSALLAKEKTVSDKQLDEQPRGFLEILIKSKETASSAKMSPVSPPSAAVPGQVPRSDDSQKGIPLFLQKFQKPETPSKAITDIPGAQFPAPAQSAQNPLAGLLKAQPDSSPQKTTPPVPLAEPGQHLQAAKRGAIGARELFNKGVDLEKNGKPQEAAEAYRQVIAADKNFTPAYINMGNLYLNQWGKPWQAISLYRRAMENSPENPKLHNNMGVAYMALQELSKAEEEFLKAADLDAKFVDPLYNLACLFARKGDAATSLSWLQKAHASGGEEILQWAAEDQDLKDLHKFQGYQDFLSKFEIRNSKAEKPSAQGSRGK